MNDYIDISLYATKGADEEEHRESSLSSIQSLFFSAGDCSTYSSCALTMPWASSLEKARVLNLNIKKQLKERGILMQNANNA